MQTLTIVFDGGSKRNGHADAEAYGSFKVMEWTGQSPVYHRYPSLRTNNEAEIRTATEALLFCRSHVPNPQLTRLVLKGDSQLAVYCLSGKWKTKKPHLKPMVVHFREIAAGFGAVELQWQPRSESVSVLGH